MGIMIDDLGWPPEDAAQEELIELEFMLKHCIQDIKTSVSCRREFLKHYKYAEPSDLFIDEIRKNWKLKWQIRKEIFKLHLKHGQIF